MSCADYWKHPGSETLLCSWGQWSGIEPLTVWGVVIIQKLWNECFCSQVVFVLPNLYPVTSDNLNYAPVAVGIVLVGALLFFYFPYIGAYRWYRGERHTVEDYSVRCAALPPCMHLPRSQPLLVP